MINTVLKILLFYILIDFNDFFFFNLHFVAISPAFLWTLALCASWASNY